MAHLWVRNETDEWAVASLDGDVFTLLSHFPHVARRCPNDGESALMRSATCDEVEPIWVLLAGETTSLRVNGSSVVAGIRALGDRDEIRGSSVERCFFSTEHPVAVVPSPDGEQPLFCPRCHLAIDPGTPAVRCPVCGVWHHQNDAEGPCWTYSEECAVCQHDTDLSCGYRWSPEEL